MNPTYPESEVVPWSERSPVPEAGGFTRNLSAADLPASGLWSRWLPGQAEPNGLGSISVGLVDTTTRQLCTHTDGK